MLATSPQNACEPSLTIERGIYESLQKTLPPAYRELMEHLVSTGEYRIVEQAEGASVTTTGTTNTDTQRMHGGSNVNSPICHAEVK